MVAHHPSILEGEADMTAYQPAVPILREYFYPPATYPQQKHPELRQPAIFSDGKHLTSANFPSAL